MAGGVEVDPEARVGLELRFLGTERQHPSLSDVEVIDVEVDV
jgi:hypothetical protein